ncbi:MAG TPA: thymidylate kinase [Methanocellaceae archaeon]
MRFLVIDGLDGSGKDTQALMLKEYLSKGGDEIVLRVHPSQDNAFGRASKKALMGGGKLMRMAATLFYGMDVVRSVILYCRGERTVIFVRYTMACAYLPRILIKPVYWLVSRILPRSPDMFFLDVRPEEALRRVRERGDKLEMFETLPRMEKARSRAMMIRGDWKIVDGNGMPDEVFRHMSGILSDSFRHL